MEYKAVCSGDFPAHIISHPFVLPGCDLIGADLDVKSMLGTVGLKGSVDYTIVNGKMVVENGHLVNIDEEKFISEGRKSVTDYLSRS